MCQLIRGGNCYCHLTVVEWKSTWLGWDISRDAQTRGEESVHWLKATSNGIWKKNSILGDWKRQLLIPVHKKGNSSICDNYIRALPS